MPDANKTMELAGVIAKQVQIREVCLHSAVVRQQANPPVGEESLQITHGLRVTGRFVQIHDDTVAPIEGAQVAITFHLKANPPERAPDEKDDRLYIEAEFYLSYVLKTREGISDEHLDAFARMNGLFNAWPYWREYVQSTLARMGLPTLTVPVLTSGMLVNLYDQQEPAETAG